MIEIFFADTMEKNYSTYLCDGDVLSQKTKRPGVAKRSGGSVTSDFNPIPAQGAVNGTFARQTPATVIGATPTEQLEGTSDGIVIDSFLKVEVTSQSLYVHDTIAILWV